MGMPAAALAPGPVESIFDATGTAMFTQLSLFDSAASSDTAANAAAFVHVAPAACPAGQRGVAAGEPRQRVSQPLSPQRIVPGEDRCNDELRPMGELAQLVLARYDLLARRRQEMDRRRREQPRKSIRVLNPQPRSGR